MLAGLNFTSEMLLRERPFRPQSFCPSGRRLRGDLIQVKKKKKKELALAGVAQWMSVGLGTKGSPVQFPIGGV